MDVVPVLDLKDGLVVRARMGRRQDYRPIETPLSPTSDAVEVARGLFSLHRFASLYVADLDAIERRGDNRAVLRRLRQALPGVRLWVDNGVADADGAAEWLAENLGDLVIGSETQVDVQLVRGFRADPRIVLSLDFRGGAFQGPADLLKERDCWPQRVIAMTLARVGSGAGPDLERLAEIRAAAPDCSLYAAGGVRDAADLAALAHLGVAGALVASALHDGSLTASDLAKLAGVRSR
ncbi:MAG TPA: HisA/HisF-related TIM barrel protein [Xanthobacteraceae bacterium]|nr:HisA/HisF-related TIM barrel protein [Xanthobacteraceae bacterium]